MESKETSFLKISCQNGRKVYVEEGLCQTIDYVVLSEWKVMVSPVFSKSVVPLFSTSLVRNEGYSLELDWKGYLPIFLVKNKVSDLFLAKGVEHNASDYR